MYHWFFLAGIVGCCFWRVSTVLFLVSALNRLAHAWTPVVIVDIVPIFLRGRVLCTVYGILVGMSVIYLSNAWLGIIMVVAAVFAPRVTPLYTFLCVGSGYYLAPLAWSAELLWKTITY